MLLLGPTLELTRAALGVPLRHGDVPPAGLVGSRHGEVAVDANRDKRRPAACESPLDGSADIARVRDELGLSQAQTSALLRDLAIDVIRQRPGYYAATTADMAWKLFQGVNERLRGNWRERTTRNWDTRWDPRLAALLDPELPAEGPAYERADALTSAFQPWRWRTPIAWLFGVGVLAALLVPRWRSGLLPAATALALVVAAAALDGLVWRFRYPADPLIAVVAAGGLVGLLALAVEGARRLAGRARVW